MTQPRIDAEGLTHVPDSETFHFTRGYIKQLFEQAQAGWEEPRTHCVTALPPYSSAKLSGTGNFLLNYFYFCFQFADKTVEWYQTHCRALWMPTRTFHVH